MRRRLATWVRAAGAAGMVVSGVCPVPVPAMGVPAADLQEVTVTAARELERDSDSASAGTVGEERLANRPLLRPAEVLEVVPGLIVTQHSGEGKANQYFLRGFNLDHGTDFATSVEGVPVNLPTHAHGQGYSDLNFLIPELIDRIEYKKGPYYADEGDFSTAGAAEIRYRRTLDAPFAVLSGAAEGYRRAVVAAPERIGGGDLLMAGEFSRTDGPWVLPEGYDHASALLKLTRGDAQRGGQLEAMTYEAHWHSSDQVPLRAVTTGLISPFGTIDPSDGGRTRRSSFSGALWRPLGDGEVRAVGYALNYRLDLFSDFTYFTDPRHGDQFEQYDNRRVYGGALSFARALPLFGAAGDLHAGIQLRADHIDPVGLYDTQDQVRWRTVSSTQALILSRALYVSEELHPASWWRAQLGTRFDTYRFDVHANSPANSGQAIASVMSPKMTLVFGPWEQTEYFLDAGRGFHSNDARGTTISVDPGDGVTPVSKVSPVARSLGAEAGVRSALTQDLRLAASLWMLRLDSELTLDNDASAVVPSGATRRYGLELSASYQRAQGLRLDADLAWTHARYVDHDPAGRYLPNALEQVASVGVELNRPSGWFGGARVRYFGASAVSQDDSVRSRPSLQVSGQAGYRLGPRLSASLGIYNLLDRRDYDIEYYYASRLRAEATPVSDIHFHPVEPRSVRATLTYHF